MPPACLPARPHRHIWVQRYVPPNWRTEHAPTPSRIRPRTRPGRGMRLREPRASRQPDLARRRRDRRRQRAPVPRARHRGAVPRAPDRKESPPAGQTERFQLGRAGGYFTDGPELAGAGSGTQVGGRPYGRRRSGERSSVAGPGAVRPAPPPGRQRLYHARSRPDGGALRVQRRADLPAEAERAGEAGPRAGHRSSWTRRARWT